MRNKIFMYLFFFAILFIIFQYMNEKSIFESQEKQISSLTKQKKEADSLMNVQDDAILELNYFNLMKNDKAMTYLENLGLEADAVQNMVRDQIYDLNVAPNGNPLVPVDGMEGKMRINKIKFLNHRWVIADFSDGTYWGEVLIEYFFDENNELSLRTMEGVLYPN
ncbi:hypothetical protein [Rasiella sp. SM2506]|uniref:hypothetical protein n=1 Tax=Rasiella sp. SM2506 TaxID=3423914 RepID=UPI003D7A00E3